MRLPCLAFLLALSACGPTPSVPAGEGGGAGAAGSSGSGGAGGQGSAGAAPLAKVLLGVPGGPDGLDFTPLEDDAELRLETFGQGGTHVLLGVRCIGFGTRAFVSLKARNSITGVELTAPAPARAQLLFCAGDDCDLVPITLMMGGIAASDAERDGLPIEVSAEVHNAAGVSGEATARAQLSTADL